MPRESGDEGDAGGGSRVAMDGEDEDAAIKARSRRTTVREVADRDGGEVRAHVEGEERIQRWMQVG